MFEPVTSNVANMTLYTKTRFNNGSALDILSIVKTLKIIRVIYRSHAFGKSVIIIIIIACHIYTDR